MGHQTEHHFEKEAESFSTRQSFGDELSTSYLDVGNWPGSNQLPVVYCAGYNISLYGLERLQSFDCWGFWRVFRSLESAGVLRSDTVVGPKEASVEVLRDVHDDAYLSALTTSSMKVIQVVEMPVLIIVPNFLLQSSIVRPMRLHAAGTILAAGLAIARGWAINIGGGMLHGRHNGGGGLCAFDDVTLAARRVRSATRNQVQKILYIDLNAHQANGVARDKLHFQDTDLFIVDMYNSKAYPRDEDAKAAIDVNMELRPFMESEEYNARLDAALARAACEFAPDMVVYNAGANILSGDSFGRLAVSKEGLVQRDETVFGYARRRSLPICMTISAGYSLAAADAVATSMANLFQKFDLG